MNEANIIFPFLVRSQLFSEALNIKKRNIIYSKVGEVIDKLLRVQATADVKPYRFKVLLVAWQENGYGGNVESRGLGT